MPPKRNPLGLNRLQLKTLTLLQEIARQPDYAEPDPETAEAVIRALPHPHGDHFHVGRAVVMAKDATGLGNAGVLAALIRKGLLREVEKGYALTAAGAEYPTGLRGEILHGSDH